MNTSEHLCRQAMSILRKRRSSQTVDPHDLTFLTAHVATCPRCLADSAVIRGMLDQQAKARFDEVTKRRLTDAVLAQAEKQRREEAEAPLEVKRRRFALPVAAAAAIAALVLMGLYFVFSSTPPSATPRLRVTASSREGTRIERAVSPARVAMRTASPTVSTAAPKPLPSMRTAAKNQTILMSTGIKLLVGQESEVSIRRSDETDITVMLSRGEVLASVDPTRNGPSFAVETALGRVVVKGTIFAVTADGAYDQVTVLRGKVAVTGADGAERFVVAGEKLFLADHRREPLVGVVRDDMVKDASRLAVVDEQTHDLIDWRRHNEGLTDRGDSPDGPSALRGSPAPATRIKPLGAPAAPAPSTIRALRLEIRKYRMAQAWTEVTKAYEQLIDTYPASEEAAAALVSLGDVQLNKLNRAEAALALFDRYINGGGDTVMEEALVGKAAALRRLGRLTEEQSVIERIIARFPQSIHAPAAKERLKNIKEISHTGAPASDVTGTQWVKER